MKAFEANFDGLVGPTHNYAGLSFGNIASESHIKDISNPKAAAKQGLRKMKALADKGFKQGVLPPQQRPDLESLRRLGFTGTDAQILTKAAKQAPAVLASVFSAASMWTANAATVSPSADTEDGRVHFTPANLNAKFHRSMEHETTGAILKRIFNDSRYFMHHQALPENAMFGDEGAANHTRLCSEYGEPGVEFFVYGRQAFNESTLKPRRYPARQTFEASEAIARLHGLNRKRTVFAQQHPDTIDSGVFHNDVISVGNRNLLFYHEAAFVNSDQVIEELNQKLENVSLNALCVRREEVSVEDAVRSYLFNSQLLSLDSGKMMLVVPQECRQIESISRYLDTLLASGGPVSEVEAFDLRQSMKNGGGPACLRLRVVLNEAELRSVKANVMMNDALFETLDAWVDKHYRDQLSQSDMADTRLVQESLTALDELTQILKVGCIYPFQRA